MRSICRSYLIHADVLVRHTDRKGRNDESMPNAAQIAGRLREFGLPLESNIRVRTPNGSRPVGATNTLMIKLLRQNLEEFNIIA